MPRISLLVLVLFSSPALAQSGPPRLSMDWEAMAARIVQQLALEPGEKVLSVAHPGLFEELVPHLRYQVVKAGGIDLGVIDVLREPVPPGWDSDLLQRALGPSREAYRSMLAELDASIMLPGTNPGHPVYAAIQDLLRKGKGRTIHFHWVENGSAFALPGQPLPPRHVVDAAYQKALLETDYQALAAAQGRFEVAMRRGEVRVTSPLGTDIRFRIGDRPVNRQDGDASASRAAQGIILIDREIELPSGAVRVAPLEETVEGTIAFPPSQWDGRPVEGLKLRFEKGRVVELTAVLGRDAVEAEMSAAGPSGRAFREFALGLNPELAVPERRPWIPYYGYGAGVVRLSLGDNSELGGTVSGGYVRWNFFTDTTVSVNGEVWVRDGRLVK
ncbi:MAG: aminopeptidase [Acidobacteriota bacterium]